MHSFAREPKHALVSTLFLVSQLASSVAHAELPRHILRHLQDQAPEALTIRVVKVIESCSQRVCSFDVTADVHCVRRSQTNLKAPQSIRITYVSFFDRPGSPVQRIAEGSLYPAFLKPSGSEKSVYLPAAASATFSGFIPLTGDLHAPTEPFCTP